MKKLGFLLTFVFEIGLSLAFISCGGSSVKIDPNLSSEEIQAVVKTEKSLPRDAKIESYEVVKSTLPLALLENEYRNLRDQVNKAKIDYRTNITRGLQQVAQKNIETLQSIQNVIIEKAANIESSSPEYIFVLANVKERGRRDGKHTGYIAIYDPTTLEGVDLIQVTTPLYNNAIMITEALDGTLINPSQNNENLKSINPVVNFILNSDPK